MKRLLVTGVPGTRGLAETAAVRAGELVVAGASVAVVVEFDRRPRPATVIAAASAKELEIQLRSSGVLPDAVTVSARGRMLFATVRTPDKPELPSAAELRASHLLTLLALLPDPVPAVVVAGPAVFRELLEIGVLHWDRVLFRSGPTPGTDRDEAGPDPLLELAVAEAGEHAETVEVADAAPDRFRAWRASAGRPGSARRRPASRGADLTTEPGSADPNDGDLTDGDPIDGDPIDGDPADAGRWWQRPGRRHRISPGESGQATPLVLGGVFVLVLGAVVLVMLGGAITGKARGQRAADLSALSAARSMKEDLPRLMAPPTLPNGAPNPYHMPKPVYLARARLAAVRNATANGASPLSVTVRFPDSAAWAPVRARVSIGITVRAGTGGGNHRSGPVWAEARLSAPLTMGQVPAVATGGGYSGPLAERQGRGLRPDVAAAFDAMSAAAGSAGVSLAINSAFRSDAEQARLFAANPDPRMVARPGTSLHRCGTELDLGPPAAYGWLSANASRFGFVQRYSWEAWHYGFTAGPAPCSPAANRAGSRLVGASTGDPRQAVSASLPGFVPAQFRRPILAAAMRWNVSAALLAAQLYAESGFNPRSVSPAGAMGIAQFMPGTAASYGLRDPFDPAAAIMAQAHLMSDLLRQFGSPALALAAYNAGPGAVAPCGCIPPYAETRAYVARILAMLGGAGAIIPMPMEIELVA